MAAAKANIVHAFYDAAEKLLEERSRGIPNTELASLTLQRLEDVIARSSDLGSEDFTNALNFAAGAYFSQFTENDRPI